MMPAIFFGHGNPLNALAENTFTNGWADIGRSIPRPRAILSVSAHYYIPFLMVTVNKNPPTIHDFSGFPEALYQVTYPAPGSPELAERVRELFSPEPLKMDEYWGLDHGTWSVLKHVFPESDIPVVQLSIDETRPIKFHYELAKRLMPLREEGVLIIGSGNIVHNLALYQRRNRDIQPFDWAARFEAYAKQMLLNGAVTALIDYSKFGDDAEKAVPAPDHYLPFIYMLGLRRESDEISFPVQGMDGGSVSMLAVKFG